MIRIVIADDHAPTRLGVQAALERDEDFEVVASVADAGAAVEAAMEHRPDLCLLDINMPGNGIEATSRITTALPDTAVVMLTASRDDNDLFDALRAGASGYLLKDTDPDRLPLALKGVMDGEAALPRNLVVRLMDEFRQRGRRRKVQIQGRRAVDLTARE
ncbi:MAG: response regulator transcription factor, partial [Actinomycetota bacterium]|nr:response regulator transcription factor [Actinomycetota bacterium]